MSTKVSVKNSTGHVIPVSNTVSPALSDGDWSKFANSLPNKTGATETLEFNRNDGITDGKTWTFLTSFVIDGIDVKLEERLEGTPLGSTMFQCMSAGSISTGFIDTNDAKSISFTGKSGAKYSLRWELSESSSLYMNIEYIVLLTEPAYVSIQPVMTQIETVVYLMLENRSIDNVLGWLYSNNEPAKVYPPGSLPSFDGIPADARNFYHETPYSPTKGTSSFAEPCRVPSFDPNEPMDHVENQLYADSTGVLPSGNVWATKPRMSGFAWDYYAIYEDRPGEVMGAYDETELPILYGLAKNFAVSDRWFSSVPTQTFPNRAFSVCGTSLGAEVNSDIDSSTFATSNTIFNALGRNGKTWGMYWQSENPLGTGEPISSWAPFTSYYFSKMNQDDNGSVQTYKDFVEASKAGALPNFCFLEPWWGGGKGLPSDGFVGIQGNDYHPPAWVGPAEADLNTLYEVLKASPQWGKMLFVVSFDEHGGTYDHVAPTPALAPDDNVGETGFAFDRLGVRVPTILISPYIEAGTVFRAPAGSEFDFDHTSFVATMMKWAGIDPSSADLGDRVSIAPTFEDVLSSTARTDKPSFSVPPGYAQQGGGTGHASASASAENEIAAHTRPLGIDIFRAVADDSLSPEMFISRLNDVSN